MYPDIGQLGNSKMVGRPTALCGGHVYPEADEVLILSMRVRQHQELDGNWIADGVGQEGAQQGDVALVKVDQQGLVCGRGFVSRCFDCSQHKLGSRQIGELCAEGVEEFIASRVVAADKAGD